MGDGECRKKSMKPQPHCIMQATCARSFVWTWKTGLDLITEVDGLQCKQGDPSSAKYYRSNLYQTDTSSILYMSMRSAESNVISKTCCGSN